MTQDDIIKIAREIGLCRTQSDFDDWIDAGPSTLELVEFVERIEKQLRQEMCYSWVPPHFVDLAVKTCAEKAWITLVKHRQPVEIRQAVTEAILSVGEKDESNKL